MPGKQRGKMELPAGNANRRRFMCGGKSQGGTKRKKLMGGGVPAQKPSYIPNLRTQATAQPNPPKLRMAPPPRPLPNKNAGMDTPLSAGSMSGGVRRFAKGGAGKIAKDVATTAARSAYKAKTAPVQVASMVANKIAPGSKVAKGLKKVATPFKRGGKAKKAKKRG